VPLSKFEGREPVTVTEYEYDGERLVRAVTVTEPEWTEHDQAVMIALAQYRDSLCSCCGLPKAMTLADEKDAPRFVVAKRYCLARKTLIESQQSFTNNGKDAKPAHGALLWSVRAQK
jgi:hypothetical protein